MSKASHVAIIVHGGAGKVPDQQCEMRVHGCVEAATAGHRVLEHGGTALDAVEAAVRILEDNPLFNAGLGAPLNAAGEIELDASIMDGEQLRAGAVAAVQGIRNPVTLARAILDDARHVLLVGEGARSFARKAKVAECSSDEMITPQQRQRWLEKHGTVGCVALDRAGHIAAATSTGGLFDKLPGRVGDSALIGCGTYANAGGGASCTGIGEAIIRVVLAKTACDRLAQGEAPASVAREAVDFLHLKTAGEAGIILLDGAGRSGYAHNARHMAVCTIDGQGRLFSTI